MAIIKDLTEIDDILYKVFKPIYEMEGYRMIGKVDGTSLNLVSNIMIRDNSQKNDVSPVQKSDLNNEEKVKPIQDEYISSKDKEEEHTGLYKVVNDENGNKKIVYDKIEKEIPKTEEQKTQKENAAQGNDERKDVKDTKKAKEKKEMGYVNTDAVDREIVVLKKKRDSLLKEIAAFSDNNPETEAKLDNLKRELEQVEQELMQKDNDGYRKQNASFSKGVVME